MTRQTRSERDARFVDRFGVLTTVTIITIVLLMLFNIDPVVDNTLRQWESVVTSVLVGLTLVLALRASGIRYRWQRIGDLMVIVALVTITATALIETIKGAPILGDNATPAPLFVVILTLFAPAAVMFRLMQHRKVTRGTVLGAISGYLLIALMFFYLFLAVSHFESGLFFGQPEPTQSYMYFSLVTITTTGYGDLTASTDVGRLLATSEAVIGQIYMVIFVAMIVGLFVSTRQSIRMSGNPDASGSGSAESGSSVEP
ncbi:MAG: hypothetical protein GC156_15795 [Actinomycetales bacterium]|nr:hypothetical protein [Actinomycetales bacterium]